MNIWAFAFKKILGGLPLVFGVTLLAFVLMVYFGPDLTYELLGKNPSPDAIDEIRDALGYNHPFWQRYWVYLTELITFDFGLSMVKDQPVNLMIYHAVPISLLLILPGFIIGNLLAIVIALLAIKHRGTLIDKSIMTFSVIGMSISFLIIIISFQLIFSSSYGLDWFPVRGWQIHDSHGNFSWAIYLKYVAVPTFALVFVSLGYNTRFYRAVFAEELSKDYITTAKAYGHSSKKIYCVHLLKNAMIPIITRIMFSIPLIVISGSLLIESYFGIPGIGLITFDAIVAGDQPILKAIVGMTAVLFVMVLIISEILYRFFDPRIDSAYS